MGDAASRRGWPDYRRFAEDPLFHFVMAWATWGDPDAARLAAINSPQDAVTLLKTVGDSPYGYREGQLPNREFASRLNRGYASVLAAWKSPFLTPCLSRQTPTEHSRLRTRAVMRCTSLLCSAFFVRRARCALMHCCFGPLAGIVLVFLYAASNKPLLHRGTVG